MKSNPIFKFALLRSISQTRRQSPTTQQGFTLVEVLVAVVVLSIFVLAAMSALVIGLNGKLKSKLNNEATLIIEQDLESVRYASTQLGLVSGAPTINTSSSSISLNLTSSPSVALVIPVTLAKVRNTDGTLVGTNYLFTATKNAALKIDLENSAYTLTSVPTAKESVSVEVTMTPSKITVPATTLKTDLAAITASSKTTIPTATDATSRIKVGDRIMIGPSSGKLDLFSVIVTDITTTQIEFVSPASTVAYAAGTPITVLPRSGDTIVNKSICSATIASTFMSFIPNLDKSSIPFNGRSTYKLTRKATDLNPIVQLDYSVTDPTVSTSTTDSLATLTTQVIPNVASQCP